jgi:SpoVK/Ycf46/Vps4 family AAA+-type ATPase
MTTANEIKGLVKSHVNGEHDRFLAAVEAIAANADGSGQVRFAQDLRCRGESGQIKTGFMIQLNERASGFLLASNPEQGVDDLIVEEDVRSSLDRILAERKQGDRLREYGFNPISSALFIGPPGVGKTLSASALAGDLGLPLFSVRLDTLIKSHLGETAGNLRVIFDTIDNTQGVFFFDEVDAVATEREDSNDVGEIRRSLNSFLQFLEQRNSTSLIVAATNHPQLLDRAIWRRFDQVIEYGLPTPEAARQVICRRLESLNIQELVWGEIDEATANLSHSELTIACEQAAKEMILSGGEIITTKRLVAALHSRRGNRNLMSNHE